MDEFFVDAMALAMIAALPADRWRREASAGRVKREAAGS